MDYRENRIQRLLHWVYLIMCVHGLWAVGLLFGFGVFGLVPTTVTAFDIIREATDEYTGARLKVFPYWQKQFKVNFRKYHRSSLIYSTLLYILTMNYTFLSIQTSLVTLILFYIVLFLFIFSLIAFLWFSFIAAEYPHLKQKEIIQNAIALPMSRVLEMIIYFTLLISALLAIWNVSPGTIVFTGMGIVVAATHWVFIKIRDGLGVHLLFDSLKRNNRTI